MNIHIISFNIPYPADYGGVIDVFYKIRALSSAGVNIHLHCFKYGRSESEELNKYCKQVTYYSRNMALTAQCSTMPFIVESRKSEELTNNLLKDDYPILVEGIHCAAILTDHRFDRRRVVVRAHNVEYDYYRGLMKMESNPVKKLYFFMESHKLKRFERVVSKASAVAAISENDHNHFAGINRNTVVVTPFHQHETCTSTLGKGNYILIHGDLSVSENVKSILWLTRNVVSECDYNFVVAGKNPTSGLRRILARHHNITLVPNPSNDEMDRLIANSHICLIHSLMPQGFKLKLLHSLHAGRFCLCNSAVIANDRLGEVCETADSEAQFIGKINTIMNQDFTIHDLNKRINIFGSLSNRSNAQQLITLLFPDMSTGVK